MIRLLSIYVSGLREMEAQSEDEHTMVARFCLSVNSQRERNDLVVVALAERF
jgi:hypothetical protein